MKHYVLTRAVYGPDWPLEANARRLAITRAVTARLMAAQTFRDWTWLVLLDPRDELLAERTAVFAEAAPSFVPIHWTPDTLARAPWDKHPELIPTTRELIAATAYRAPWRSYMDDGPLLQTRLDDDDGLSVNALARYQHAARRLDRRTVLMLPMGLRVYGSRYQAVPRRNNAMHTLYTPDGDGLCVYDYGHTRCFDVARVVNVDRQFGWLWVRHADTLSEWRGTRGALNDGIRGMFPIDWAVVEAAR